MMVSNWRDDNARASVWQIILPDAVMEEVELDPMDKAVINSPVEQVADILQSLEIIARRWHEQQQRKRRDTIRWN